MDESELLALIEKDESETVEFKKSTAEMEQALRSACAFLNHKGGLVFFGIEKKRIVGQEVSDQTLRSISQKVRQRIKPEVSPEIGVLEIQSKKVIEVKFKGGNDKMHYLDGVAYRRVGSENVVIPPGELERIILEKSKIHWDSEVCEGASSEDIDAEKARWFLGRAMVERNLNVNPRASMREILEKLGLAKGKRLTNAAMLLFGSNPQHFFLQAEVRCAKFKGVEAVKPFLDMKAVGGTIFQQADEAEKFVLNNIKKAAWTEPGKIERQEKWEYPMDAVREAIINAVCHRDYGSSSNVQIRIFDDRLEVWNPGRLPNGWTVETLRKKHESKPHNPSIAKVFFLAGYIEQWGTGTTDIIKEAIAHGLPEPLFEEIAGSFVVTFRKHGITDELLAELNERQKKAIAYLKANKKISRANYASLAGCSVRTAFNDLHGMVSEKILRVKGKGKNTFYELL